MILTVDPSSAVPPYEQIRAQLEAMVASGTLEAGDRLPSIRQLAHDLGLATGTVARAYAELESAGLVVSRRRTGTVVADGVAASPSERRRRLSEAAEQYARAVALLGVAPDDAQAAVLRALAR
ncbi:MAG: GntR family transcriptional regulator [Actinobacteria bacterium]|nr:GntR family transcriptional regulator [Actinomycetota bacterium]